MKGSWLADCLSEFEPRPPRCYGPNPVGYLISIFPPGHLARFLTLMLRAGVVGLPWVQLKKQMSDLLSLVNDHGIKRQYADLPV
jgi:hypothetical protein